MRSQTIDITPGYQLVQAVSHTSHPQAEVLQRWTERCDAHARKQSVTSAPTLALTGAALCVASLLITYRRHLTPRSFEHALEITFICWLIASYTVAVFRARAAKSEAKRYWSSVTAQSSGQPHQHSQCYILQHSIVSDDSKQVTPIAWVQVQYKCVEAAKTHTRQPSSRGLSNGQPSCTPYAAHITYLGVVIPQVQPKLLAWVEKEGATFGVQQYIITMPVAGLTPQATQALRANDYTGGSRAAADNHSPSATTFSKGGVSEQIAAAVDADRQSASQYTIRPLHSGDEEAVRQIYVTNVKSFTWTAVRVALLSRYTAAAVVTAVSAPVAYHLLSDNRSTLSKASLAVAQSSGSLLWLLLLTTAYYAYQCHQSLVRKLAADLQTNISDSLSHSTATQSDTLVKNIINGDSATPNGTNQPSATARVDLWVAVHSDNTVAGCIGIETSSKNTHQAHIKQLSVSAVHQHRGVASSLLQHAEQQATARGAYHFTATTPHYNTSAIRFYERAGYWKVHRKSAHIKDTHNVNTTLIQLEKFTNLPEHYQLPTFYEDDKLIIRQFRPADYKECIDIFIVGMEGLRVPNLITSLKCTWALRAYAASALLIALRWAPLSIVKQINTYIPLPLHILIALLPVILGVGFLAHASYIRFMTGYIQWSLNDDLRDPHQYYHHDREHAVFFVAENKATHRVCGIVSLDNRGQKPAHKQKSATDAPQYWSAELRRMSVLIGQRGMRIGDKLTAAWKQYAIREGYTRIFLGTSSVQKAACALYEKHGWVLQEQTNMFQGTGLRSYELLLPATNGSSTAQ